MSHLHLEGQALIDAFLAVRPNRNDTAAFERFMRTGSGVVKQHFVPVEVRYELKALVSAIHCSYVPHALEPRERIRLLDIVVGWRTLCNEPSPSAKDPSSFAECVLLQLKDEYEDAALIGMMGIACAFYKSGSLTCVLSEEDYERCLWVAAEFRAEWVSYISRFSTIDGIIQACRNLQQTVLTLEQKNASRRRDSAAFRHDDGLSLALTKTISSLEQLAQSY